MSSARRSVVPILSALALGIALAGCGAGGVAARHAVRISHSAFVPALLTVPVDRPVTFVLRNDDPIDHEWIVGDEATHARHRDGTEPVHDERPTEVSVAALRERSTTVTFEHTGDYTFVCHLPGHEAYGMTGTVRVV